MSYEGYRQILCSNGHYHTQDAYEVYWDDYSVWSCPDCGAKEAWSNGVDVTNGSYDINPDTGEEERIDGYIELEVDKPAQMCKCSACGHEHAIAPATYKIPRNEEEGESHVDRTV